MQASSHQDRESLSDARLFEEIASDHRWAFSVLYDRHAPMLYGLAMRILRDKALAEDVIQEVFLTIWQKASRFDARRGSPVAWMTILCRNRCIDKLRSADASKLRSAAFDEESYVRDDLGDRPSDPLDHAAQSLLRKHVSSALATLPPEQRQLIEMAYFEGFTQSEIAHELSLPLGTVKTRIRLGMQRLQLLLDERR